MGWDIDLDEIEPDEIGSFRQAEPGKYHVLVTSVDDEATSKGTGSPQIEVWLQILAGTTKGQAGVNLPLYLPTAGKPGARKKALQFALATKLTSVDELKAAKTNGESITIDWQKAVGRELCVEVEAEEYQGKVRPRINFGLWAVDSPEAASIPKSKDGRAKAGDAGDDPFGGGDGSDGDADGLF